MSFEALSGLANLPFAEIYIAAEMQARDPATETQRFFYITNAPRLFTEPTDTPPNQAFRSILVKGWRTERRLTEQKVFTGPSTFNHGTLIVDNSPTGNEFAASPGHTDDTKGPFDDWLDLDWNGQPITLRIGARFKADGSAFRYSSYEPYFTGVIDDVRPKGQGMLEIKIAGSKILCAAPVVTETFKGFGGAASLAAGEKMETATSNAVFTLTAGLTIEFIGTCADPAIEGTLVRQGDSYGLNVDPGNALTFLHDTGVTTPTSFVIPSGHFIAAASVTAAASGFDVKVFAGADAASLQEVLSTNLTMAVTAGKVVLARPDALPGTGAAIEAREVRVWDHGRTLAEIRATADSPLSDPTSQTGLVEVWKFNEGVGTTAIGSKEVDDLIGTPAWVSTLEGDDPEEFSGDLLGKTKPDGWGEAFNVPVTMVDSQRHVGQWSRASSSDILRLKVNGAPMVPDETMTSSQAGAFSFVASPAAFTITQAEQDLTGATGARLIPGQASPAILGQAIIVENAPGYNGTYRVATDGIQDAGLTIQVVDEFGDPVVLGGASLPTGTVIRSADDEIQYTYDLATSTVDLPFSPAGFLTADVVLRLGAGATVSAIVEALLGVTVENLLTFDPIVSLYVPTGAAPRKGDLLDALMRSALGWLVEKRGGGFRIGNLELPAGTPVGALLGSRAAKIGATLTLPSVLGRITRASPVSSVIPSWRTSAGYDRSWHVFQDGSTVPSIPAAMRKRLEDRFRVVVRTYPETLVRWPTSEPLKLLETHIARRQDAEEYLGRAEALFTARRRWFDVQVAGLGMLALELNDVVYLEHPEPTLGLQTPQLARVVSMIEDTSSDLVDVGLYL